MTGLDLRPMSLGEILDRTFSLYRRHFLLFVGIAAIPHVLILGVTLAQVAVLSKAPSLTLNLAALVVFLIVYLFAYLFSQGGTIFAVSDLYLGRPTSIADSLRRVWGDFGFLFGVVVLNGLAVGGALLLLVIPGIYVACRLLVCVPSALIEQRGPRESLSRSFELTRDYAGRAFVIVVLSMVITWGAQILFVMPFSVAMANASKDASMLRFWQAMAQVGSSIAAVLAQPILLIATSIFYYDLRVRKEAFDLQLMMDPNARPITRPTGLPSILS